MDDSLRSFREADRSAVAELSRRALARPEEQVGNPLWETRGELDSELDGWEEPPEETLFVAVQEGTVVGFGGIEVHSEWTHADLFGPLVAPAYRGQRIGTRLLEASVEAGRARGVNRIIGSLGTRNAAGRMMLERARFRVLDRVEAVFRLLPSDHRPVEGAPDNVSVRRGTPEDIDVALALYHECFPEGLFPDSVWRAGLERGTVYLAEFGGRAVAFVDVDPSDRWLYHVGVTESERAHGVGSYVLSRALQDYWTEHPGEALGLSTAGDNVPAIRLYRRQGFAPLLVLQRFGLEL